MRDRTRAARGHAVVRALPLLCGLIACAARPARAAGIVTDCSDDREFSSALAGAGVVKFDCAGAKGPVTITLATTKTIFSNTTIDGEDEVTLSGGDVRRLFVVAAGAGLGLANVTLAHGHVTGDGGAIFNAGFLALDAATIVDSSATGNGGAVATRGRVDVTHAVLARNQATGGGAIYATGSAADVTVASSTIEDGMATGVSAPGGRGGAILLTGGASASVFSSELDGNRAVDAGGAIACSGGALLLQASQLLENRAASGAGLFVTGCAATLDSATIAANQATSTGGGVKNDVGGTVTLSNVTVSANSAFGGGGLYNHDGTATLRNVTLVGNSARNGGGGITNSLLGSPHLSLTNVLIADSPLGGDCFLGNAPDASVANLASDGTCAFGAGRDGVAVLVGPLETNGGNTLTHRLLPGSPAIDAGASDRCPAMDQRFVSRGDGTGCDVGAVAFSPCSGAPPAVALLSPERGEAVGPFEAVLDWAGGDCAQSFRATVRKRKRTGQVVFDATTRDATQITTTAFAKPGRYFWRVTACNAAGCTATGWRRFKVHFN
jgi:predicted outer membrane repeat protein